MNAISLAADSGEDHASAFLKEFEKRMPEIALVDVSFELLHSNGIEGMCEEKIHDWLDNMRVLAGK